MEQMTFAMPGAGDEYLAARGALMSAERELREQVERVAEMRRSLPPGPLVPDYVFFDGDKRVRLYDLFSDGKPYLLVYHFMHWQDDQEFCPMCSMWVDAWDGIAHHVEQRANIVAATLAPVDKVRAWAQHRGWHRIRVLADADAAFACDTGAENDKGDPQPTVLVFEKTEEGVRHRYTGHAENNEGINRGLDQLCPTWHIFDLLPSGRGDWNASNSYVEAPAS
jgi:predicted dithiol-disulfide oxidoreductase (DUF899 family)